MSDESGPADPRHDAALAVLQNMYNAYIVGDSAAIDTALSADVTMFDSAHPDLIVGLDELNVVRSRRHVASDENVIETAVTVLHPRSFDKGDAILIAYWLRVDSSTPRNAPCNRSSHETRPGCDSKVGRGRSHIFTKMPGLVPRDNAGLREIRLCSLRVGKRRRTLPPACIPFGSAST
jgi:hypothetical protein